MPRRPEKACVQTVPLQVEPLRVDSNTAEQQQQQQQQRQQQQQQQQQKLQHSKLTQYRYMPGVMMVVNNCRYLPYNNSTLTWCRTLPYNESICSYANAVCKVVLVVWEMFMHLIVFAIISFKLRSNILMFTCVDVCFKFVCR